MLNHPRVLKHATSRLHVELSRPDTIPLQYRETAAILVDARVCFGPVYFYTSPPIPTIHSHGFALEKSLPSQILQLAWASYSLGRANQRNRLCGARNRPIDRHLPWTCISAMHCSPDVSVCMCVYTNLSSTFVFTSEFLFEVAVSNRLDSPAHPAV